VLLFAILGKSFEGSVVESMVSVYRAPIVVTSAQKAYGYVEGPMDDEVRGRISEIPGVATVGGLRQVKHEYLGGEIGIDACDTSYLLDTRLGQWKLSGGSLPAALELVASGQAVLVSPAFVQNLGARIGEALKLNTPRGLVEFLVAGVTPNLRFNSGRGTVIMSRKRYRELWNDSMVNRIHVAVSPGVSPEAVRARIAKHIGRDYRLRLLSAPEMVEHYAGEVRKAFALQHVTGVVALALVLFGIYDCFSARVMERVRQFGLMRGLGIGKRSLFLLVISEALGLWVAGAVVAVLAGGLLGRFWVGTQFPAVAGYILELIFPYEFAGGALVVAAFVCLAGAALPSFAAANVVIREALREEQ